MKWLKRMSFFTVKSFRKMRFCEILLLFLKVIGRSGYGPGSWKLRGREAKGTEEGQVKLLKRMNFFTAKSVRKMQFCETLLLFLKVIGRPGYGPGSWKLREKEAKGTEEGEVKLLKRVSFFTAKSVRKMRFCETLLLFLKVIGLSDYGPESWKLREKEAKGTEEGEVKLLKTYELFYRQKHSKNAIL